ncbi:MAG: ABC-F family ATP-binding cassette domain-containing protein, partial [Acidobacteria bacterium]|nr:ABC-F family ATP-binding cassette domain-containing protein [Acidobacteriota bacterium]
MVNIENLSKSFGPQVLFKDATFLIGDHAKVGVIGPNGAGKSTLFKILVGEDSPDHGEIRYSKNTTLAVLRQEWLPHEGDTVLNATLRIHSKWFSAKNAMHELDPTSKEYHEAESHF